MVNLGFSDDALEWHAPASGLVVLGVPADKRAAAAAAASALG
jgi:hypothetical protein